MSSISPHAFIVFLVVYCPLLIIAGNIAAKGRQHGLCTLSQFLSCVVLALLGQQEALPVGLGVAVLIANILLLIRLARNAARLEKTPDTSDHESQPRD